MIFSSSFLHAVTFYMFSTSMSLEDRLRLKLKVKTNICLYMAINYNNAGPPMAILYIHSTTVLCDTDAVYDDTGKLAKFHVYPQIDAR